MDAALSVPAGTDFSRLTSYSGALKRLSIDAIKEELIGSEYTETHQEIKDTRFSDGSYVLLEKGDGAFLACSEEAITFFTPKADKILTCFVPEYSSEYNGDSFLTDREFSFGTKEECFHQLQDLLDLAGVSVSNAYLCFIVDHETLSELVQESNEKLINNGIQIQDFTFSEEDDCYFYKLFVCIDDIPMTRLENGIFENGGLTPGSVIDAIVSKDGISYLNISSIYEPVSPETILSGLGAEDAIARLDEKYNSIILDGEYEVFEQALEYVPISEKDKVHVKLVPAWRFAIKHLLQIVDKSDPSQFTFITQYEYVLFDALSGEEILRDAGGI